MSFHALDALWVLLLGPCAHCAGTPRRRLSASCANFKHLRAVQVGFVSRFDKVGERTPIQ